MTLNDLEKGIAARVTSVAGDGAITKRLMEMGVIPGVTVSVVKSAPFNDPIEIRILGYSLAIRRNEARAVEVEI